MCLGGGGSFESLPVRPCKGNIQFLVPTRTYFYMPCGPLILSKHHHGNRVVMRTGYFLLTNEVKNVALMASTVISNIKINRPRVYFVNFYRTRIQEFNLCGLSVWFVIQFTRVIPMIMYLYIVCALIYVFVKCSLLFHYIPFWSMCCAGQRGYGS